MKRFATAASLSACFLAAAAFAPASHRLAGPSLPLRSPLLWQSVAEGGSAGGTRAGTLDGPVGDGGGFEGLLELAGAGGPAAPSGSPALGPGWESAVDQASGGTYYFNRATGESSWEVPTDPRAMVGAAPGAASGDEGASRDAGGLREELDASRLHAKELTSQLHEAKMAIAKMEISVSFLEVGAKSKEREIARLRATIEAMEEESSTAKETISNEAPEPRRTEEEENQDGKSEALRGSTSTGGEPPADAGGRVPSPEDALALREAASRMDATAVSALLDAGIEMDEATTAAAFRATAKAVDRAEAEDKPMPADVPRMLHLIFDADMRHLSEREKITTNVTCMQPTELGLTSAGMSYIFDDSSHKDLPLKEGRRCEDGACCDECSRNVFPTFATEGESDLETYPELASLTFNDLEKVSTRTILNFMRLIERVRRTIAKEYGLPLRTILPLQAYSRKYVAGAQQKGGGSGTGDFVILHTDEATHTGYHYSCVLYLSTQGEDFEGGEFVFNDPDPNKKKSKDVPPGGDEDEEDEDEEELTGMSLAEQIRRAGRVFAPFSPTRGAAVIFSSGWENMHEVSKITSGTRYAVPCFFTTCPVPDMAYEQMVVGKPKTDEDIADDWLHLLLARREETPHESLGRVKELLMKWHCMCTPLGEH